MKNKGRTRQVIARLAAYLAVATLASPAAAQAEPEVNWFPIAAKYAPGGDWLVVNLCSFHNPLYCKLVRWEPDGAALPLPGGRSTTGRWSLIAGQDADKTYIWPEVSPSGQKLAYVVAGCTPKAGVTLTRKGQLAANPEQLDCGFYDGQPAISESVVDIRQGQQLAPVYGASKPTWRPDGKALLYWRTVVVVTLASGRNLGQRDVYEYDFESKKEAPKHDRGVTRVFWSMEATGPFYSADGNSFTVCGIGMSVPPSMDQDTRVQCMTTTATYPYKIRGIKTRTASPPFTAIIGKHDDQIFYTRGETLSLTSSSSFSSLKVLFPTYTSYTNLSPHSISSVSGKPAVILSGSLGNYLIPIRQGSYFNQLLGHLPASPVMFLVQVDSVEPAALQPVFWPSVDQLDSVIR